MVRRKVRAKSKPVLGKQMTAAQYLEGWRERKTWAHNYNDRHALRFNWLAKNIVGEKFADIGCALGHSTELLARMHPGNWTGVEFNIEAVNDAVEQFHGIPFVYVENIAALPRLGKFDTVVCSEVIEHVEDPAALLLSLLEITGKRLLMTTPCKNVGDPGHVRIYDDATLASLFTGLDYGVDKDSIFYKIAVNA